MKTMLVGINARYIHVNAALYSLRASAAAYAKRLDGPAGELVLREFTVNQGAEAIYYSILREQPRAVAFSVYLWNVRLVRDLCRDLRRACPDCLLILGGGLGNIVDRVWHGYVVDMFDLLLFDYPVFNLADCFLVVGVILGAIYYLWFYEKYDRKTKEEPKHESDTPSGNS